MKKRMLAILLCAIMILVLASCGTGGSNAGGSDTKKTNLVYAVDSEPTTLDVFQGIGYGAYALDKAVYEYLWYFNAKGDIVYQLATDFAWDSTETVLTIHLRKDVTFHNGNPLTSDDVLYTLERIAATERYASNVACVDVPKCTCPDDYTIELHLKQVSGALIYGMVQPYWLIHDREYCEKNGENAVTTNAVGTGPYKLESWEQGKQFNLVKNDKYWGTPATYETVTIKFIGDSLTRMMEFENGNIDAVVVASSIDADAVSSGEYEGASLVQIPKEAVYGFCFNMNTPEWAELWSDINLRKAICHAIDVPTMVKTIAGSIYKTADSILPSGDWAYVSTGYYKYDPEYAKECLAAAGYAPDELEFTTTVPNAELYKQFSESIQAYLKTIGIKMNVEVREYPVWGQTLITGGIPAGVAGCNGASDPSDLSIPKKLQSGHLLLMWPTKEIADLDNAAEATNDKDARKEMYVQIQEMMHDGYYYAPIYETSAVWAVKDYVTGWAESCDSLQCPAMGLVGYKG